MPLNNKNWMDAMFIVGLFDGAHFMLGILKQVLPVEKTEFLINPHISTAASLNLIIYSLFGNHHKQFLQVCRAKKTPIVCISGEPLNLRGARPYTADILIDCKIVPAFQIPRAKFYYLPFYVTSFGERYTHRPEDLLVAAANPTVKTKFCAFLYSRDVPHRNQMFDSLSKLVRNVDALGKCRNKKNPHVTSHDRGSFNYNDLAVQKYQPYKFVIACENTRLQGYITEKIVSAMLAGAIPIYYGAPDIAEHFNPKSFIDASVVGWEERVLELDRDPELYQQMLAEPWCVSNTLNRYFDVNRVLAGWLEESLKTSTDIRDTRQKYE